MEIEIASLKHIKYCKIISETITDSAKVRGTGIALRTPEYIETKIRNKNAIIATDGSKFAGFCYIEIWGHGKYVAHSGLIVYPDYRGIGLAKKIKKKTFEYSKLTDDKEFWKGCQTCKNYDILQRTRRKMCLCTGMLYNPNKNI